MEVHNVKMGMIKAGKKTVVEKMMRILALFLVCVLVANGSGLSVFAAEIGDANAEETMTYLQKVRYLQHSLTHFLY